MDNRWWIKSPWKGEDSIALWICNYSPQHTARRDFVFKNCIKCQSHWVWWTLKAPHPSRDHAVRLWYNKGRVVSLQVLQIQTQLPDFKNLPSLTHRNLILGRNKTKTNIHSGTSAERATPRPLVSELFPSLPIPPPPRGTKGLPDIQEGYIFWNQYHCTQESSWDLSLTKSSNSICSAWLYCYSVDQFPAPSAPAVLVVRLSYLISYSITLAYEFGLTSICFNPLNCPISHLERVVACLIAAVSTGYLSRFSSSCVDVGRHATLSHLLSLSGPVSDRVQKSIIKSPYGGHEQTHWYCLRNLAFPIPKFTSPLRKVAPAVRSLFFEHHPNFVAIPWTVSWSYPIIHLPIASNSSTFLLQTSFLTSPSLTITLLEIRHWMKQIINLASIYSRARTKESSREPC